MTDALNAKGRAAKAFWTDRFSSITSTSGPVDVRAAARAMASLQHPQAFGNYFTYGAAIEILGLDAQSLFVDGSLRLPPDYVDFGYMRSRLGPPKSAMAALGTPLTADDVAEYPPDLTDALRELVAMRKFGRSRDENFDVLGTEGAQGAIGYAFLSYLDPGDEILVTDPGYMHFASGPPLTGASVRTIPLTARNNFRLDPNDVAAAITPRTKMLVVCDPINPFGTVQTRDELIAIAKICKRRGVLILNNTAHATHQVNPAASHTPMASLHRETDVDHVISVSGLSKGYALASIRLGFMAGHPRLLQAAAQVRTEIAGIHVHPFAQRAAMAALSDDDYVTTTTMALRRNLQHLREALAESGDVTFAVEPDYGFCACLDVSRTGVSAQELTVALFKQGICVIAGDAFGEIGATRHVRVNFSSLDVADFERLRCSLPVAVRDAQSGRYLRGVEAFYRSKSGPRARKIVEQFQSRTRRSSFPANGVIQDSRAILSTLYSPTPEVAIPRQLPPAFVSDVVFDFGPLDLLSHFFNAAYKAARAYGVHVAFGTFDELLRVNLANQSSWRAIIPTFDPRLSVLDPHDSFCLLGYDDKGDVVATQACRLFRWQTKSFYEAASDLSLYYARPERDAQPGETCEVTAEHTRKVRGRVAFSGAGWYRPDYRGGVLSRILPRISRAYAFTRWSTDYTASMIQDSVLAGGMAKRSGYENIDTYVHVKKSPMGDIKFAFVWMEADTLIEDLRNFDGLADTKVHTSVRD